jgi:hypothetical protein
MPGLLGSWVPGCVGVSAGVFTAETQGRGVSQSPIKWITINGKRCESGWCVNVQCRMSNFECRIYYGTNNGHSAQIFILPLRGPGGQT